VRAEAGMDDLGTLFSSVSVRPTKIVVGIFVGRVEADETTPYCRRSRDRRK
jgi:hypothetical protein